MEMNRKKGQRAANLVLVRHGEDADNAANLINGRRDPPLTDRGIQQAVDVAAKLFSADIGVVYTSPLERARRTAEIICQRLGRLQLQVDEDLIERDYGILTGKPPSDIPALATRTLASNGFQYVIAAPGAEDYLDLWIRAGNVLNKVLDGHSGRAILIVAHNEIIKMMRANFENRSWETELQLPPLRYCEMVTLRR
jgi:probable phosphoglycerate mutase